uniref:Uncharacterized protein n=1 Tax=Lactuca sativa TaxID=4236 RepID=A0A9R1VF73_LACSA|nr:hypothetical protein LSAT_V11C500245450 [Lactuca sativa]
MKICYTIDIFIFKIILISIELDVCVHVTRLINKVVVVTGGARGIGGATAKLMAENGAHVVIADILDELGINLANSINGRYVHCDVSVESDVEAAIQFAITWKGKIDILYNNAGIGGTFLFGAWRSNVPGRRNRSYLYMNTYMDMYIHI